MAKAVPIIKTGTILTKIVKSKKKGSRRTLFLFEQSLNSRFDILLGDFWLHGFL